MKNNILLIAAVTIISVGIIAAVIVFSTVGKGSESSDSSNISDSLSDLLSDAVSVATAEEESAAPTEESEVAESVDAAAESETSEQQSDDITPEAEGVVSLAKSLIGVEFVDGGDSPSGFDNSGFIYYVLRENGYITCPRGVAARADMGTRLDYDELKSGDLVFFYNNDGTAAGFGGIYIGGGRMIACLMPGTVVKEVDITTSYY